MLLNDNLAILLCGLSSDNHFIEAPVSLYCGHSVCIKCLPEDRYQAIKCLICGYLTEEDFKHQKESKVSKFAIQMCLENLFTIIEQKTSNQLSKIKSKN